MLGNNIRYNTNVVLENEEFSCHLFAIKLRGHHPKIINFIINVDCTIINSINL